MGLAQFLKPEDNQNYYEVGTDKLILLPNNSVILILLERRAPETY
jgi:hypothetical protein